MGVDGLWSLLNPVAKQVNLEDSRCKKLAVDLSAWIMQCSSVSTSKSISPGYLCCRGLFMRTLNLLSLGISLVFVIDGPTPPAVKKKVKSRNEFYQSVVEYKELLSAMGLPVLESKGEAEKLCAELNRKQLVDGILTNDGDALIYGAQTVYKDLFQDKKDHIATMYQMQDITSTLNLTNRDLVAFALLSGGDFCHGVPQVREKKFTGLMNEFRTNKISDALDRLMSWASNSELDLLNVLKKSCKKRKHCTKCQHEGTKQNHVTSGCVICQFEAGCQDKNAPDHVPCSCQPHKEEEKFTPYIIELSLRDLALTNDPSFPDHAVISEFLEPLHNDLTDAVLKQNVPDFSGVCRIINEKLKYDYSETMSYLLPATIKMAFHGLLPDLSMRPLSITRACKDNSKQCYVVKWQKLEQDEFSELNSYEVKLSQDLFTLKYPDLVEQYKADTKCATGKRKGSHLKQDDPSQPKITSMFKTIKNPPVKTDMGKESTM